MYMYLTQSSWQLFSIFSLLLMVGRQPQHLDNSLCFIANTVAIVVGDALVNARHWSCCHPWFGPGNDRMSGQLGTHELTGVMSNHAKAIITAFSMLSNCSLNYFTNACWNSVYDNSAIICLIPFPLSIPCLQATPGLVSLNNLCMSQENIPFHLIFHFSYTQIY